MSKTRYVFKFDPAKCECGTGCNNGQRAGNAEFGVEAASRSRGETVHIDEDSIRDLIADLGHLCDREGLTFGEIIKLAKNDWEAER